MLSALVLSTALYLPAAPAPKETAPAPAPADTAAGQPPRIVELKPEKDGKVRLQVSRPRNNNGGAVGIAVVVNGNGANQNIVINGAGPVMESVEPADLKDLKVTTAGGKEVARQDALKALAKGGVVIISTDGKKVSSIFLRAFKDDVLVLVSPDLAAQAGPNIQFQQGGFGVALPPLPPPAPPEKK